MKKSIEELIANVLLKKSFRLAEYARMGVPYEILIGTNVLGNKYAKIIQKRV